MVNGSTFSVREGLQRVVITTGLHPESPILKVCVTVRRPPVTSWGKGEERYDLRSGSVDVNEGH